MRVDLIAHLHPGSQLLNAVSDGTADLTDRRSVPNFLKTVPFSSSGVPPVAYQMLGKVPKGGLSLADQANRSGCKNLTMDLRGLHANSSRCRGPDREFDV